MGLSNYQKYSITQHFYDRAKERFDLEPEQVPAFISCCYNLKQIFTNFIL